MTADRPPRLSAQEIRALVDTKEGTTSARIFSDPDVYELEMEQIFARTWLLLGFESQVPAYGDYATAYMGEDPVVMIRQQDGSLAVWLNQCTHRGSLLCRTDRGNARSFRCPYHGWCFDAGGRLVQVPREEAAYHDELDKEQWGLVHVPRVETYRGLVFGCWDPDVRSLDDVLGDARFYLDVYFDRVEGEKEVAALHRWTTQANWKWQAEQHATDMYHAFISHASLFSVAMPGGEVSPTSIYEAPAEGLQVSSPNGHGAGFFMGEGIQLSIANEHTRRYMAETRPSAIERLGAERADQFRDMHMTVFPNMSMQISADYIRIWHPRGPSQTEVWNFIVVDRDAPQEVKDEIVLASTRAFSVTGVAEQDDVDNMGMCQRGVSGYMSRRSKLNLQRGRGHLRSHDSLPGTLAGVFSEEGARGFYERWQRLLLGEAV